MKKFRKIFSFIICLAALWSTLSLIKPLNGAIQNIILFQNNKIISKLFVYKKRLTIVKDDLLKKNVMPLEKFGYITDLGHVFFAQYVLVPINVYEGINYKYIIGDFFEKSPSVNFFKKSGLVVIKDYGNGVLLLRNEKIK